MPAKLPPPEEAKRARRVHDFLQAWDALTNTDGDEIYTIHHEPGRSVSLLKSDVEDLLAARDSLGELVEWFSENMDGAGRVTSKGAWVALPKRILELGQRFGPWYR